MFYDAFKKYKPSATNKLSMGSKKGYVRLTLGCNVDQD